MKSIMKRIYRKIKRIIKVILGKDFFIKPDFICDYKRFGSQYGGWDVIYGELNSDSVIYSFGVGEDASFDLALIKKLGVIIHAFDPTPKSITWVKDQNFPKSFIMHEYGIADFDGIATFAPPKNPDHVSHTILDRVETRDKTIEMPVKKLASIMKELKTNKIDLLKMDIEGAEYSILKDIQSNSIRPKQLLVEFHHRFPNIGIGETKTAIKIIKDMGYQLFSVSETGEEYSFILK